LLARQQGRFWCGGKRETSVLSANHVESLGQVRRVEGHRDVFAFHLDRNRFISRSVITLTSGQRNFTIAKHHQQRGVALSDQGYTLDCFNQLGGIDGRINVGLFREQRTNLGVFPIDQQAGGTTTTRGKAHEFSFVL